MEPVIVTSHNNDGQMYHIAWSPINYHEHNLNILHPLVKANYENFSNRISNHIMEQQMEPIEYTHVDFHCNTPINNRGPLAYFCVRNNHVISPIYFTIQAVQDYVNQHPNSVIYLADHNYL